MVRPVFRAGGRRRAAGASALGRRAARPVRAQLPSTFGGCCCSTPSRGARRRRRRRCMCCARPDILPGCALRPPSVARCSSPPRRGRPLRSARAAPPERRASRFARTSPLRRRRTAASRRSPVDALLGNRCARPAGKRHARAQRVDVSIDAAPKRARLVAPPPQPHRRQTAAPPGSLRAGRPGHRRAEGRAGVLAISVQPQTGADRRRDGGNLRADADALLGGGGGLRRVAARGLGESRSRHERQRVGACEVMPR